MSMGVSARRQASEGTVMAISTPTYQRLIVGVGGALLIVTLFLPWAEVDGVGHNGWQFNAVVSLYFLIGGVFGIITAVTGGQYGLCRPDVSMIGVTDAVNTVGMVLFAWLIVDYPDDAVRRPGVFCALAATAMTAFAVADYGPLRGAPWFPPLNATDRSR